MRGIFVDAGHGLSASRTIDNGASGNGTTERKEVVEIAGELLALLRSDPAFSGIECVPIGVDVRLTLREKIDQVNAVCRARGWELQDALLVSLHINAAGTPEARGIEAWYSAEEGTLDFARSLVERTASVTGLPVRRYPTRTTDQNRHGRLGIIDDTIPKGVLLECGFISNEFDATALTDAAMDDKFAEGIHAAIREYVGLPASAPVVSPTSSIPTVMPSAFSDIPADAWYRDDVAFCLREGIFQMRSDGLFRPDAPLTRAELAAVMARHLRKHHGVS